MTHSDRIYLGPVDPGLELSFLKDDPLLSSGDIFIDSDVGLPSATSHENEDWSALRKMAAAPLARTAFDELSREERLDGIAATIGNWQPRYKD